MDEALALSMALTLPAAAAIMGMPLFLIDGLFTRGEFLAFDAQNTARALFQFGWGVPAFVLIRILAPGFFARGDTRRPMIFALVSVAVNAALAITLYWAGMGVSGIAAATSAAAWVNVALLAGTLWRRGHWRPGAAVLSRVARIAVASAVLGGLTFVASLYRPQIEAPIAAVLEHGAKEIALVGVTAVGGLAYLILLFATRAVTVTEVKGLVRRAR